MIYSIGYGTRKFDEFVGLLKKYHIEYVIDVRSKPYSMINQEFNKQPFEILLYRNSIKYAFLGNELGGRPEDESCYTNGKVDYNLLEQKPFYKKGIERLKSAYEQDYDVAIMCSELKPEECHRSKLIAVTLQDESIKVQHIDENGEICDQASVIARINNGKQVRNLFGELEMTSRKKYK
jgi:uncharacterized protein (DUF488 family)